MRIRELLESKHFDDSDFIENKGDKRKINFDLDEDLMHFMHNNDDVYRRHFYPVIAKCLDMVKDNKSIKPSMFKPAVQRSYEVYLREFPIRELPKSLEEDQMKKVCRKIHTEILGHIKDGKYED